jgi:hypothetical protein
MNVRFVRMVVYTMLTLAGGAAGCASLGASGAGRQQSLAAPPAWVAQVTITRDEWGVPYIDAADDAAAAAGLAYAMAEDGYRELEEDYARALAIAAAYHGESMVASDQLRIRLRVIEDAQRSFETETAEAQRVYQGFADGLNYFMRTHPEIPPRHITRYDGWMVLAFANELATVRPVEEALLARTLPPAARITMQTGAADALGWIVRSADGRPLLLSEASAERPYEMNLHTADGWRFHAYGRLGCVIPRNGYSGQMGFTMIDPGSSSATGVHVANAVTAQRTDSLRVNTSEGVIVRRFATSLTNDGPVVAAAGDTAYVVTNSDPAPRSPWLTWRAMARARDSASFSAALRSAHGGQRKPGTTLYADASGVALEFSDGGRSEVAATAAVGARADIASSMAVSERAWTMQKLARAAFNRHVHAAGEEITALADEWEQVGARNPERALAMDSAIALLRAWDHESATESEPMTLYAAYADELRVGGSAPLAHFTALERVVLDRRRFPPRPWGSVNALRKAGHAAVPVAGAPARLGIMFAYDAASGLESVVWAVDPAGGEASSVRSFGQTMSAASAHAFDQAILFAAGSMKAAPASGPVMGSAAARVPYHPGEGQDKR